MLQLFATRVQMKDQHDFHTCRKFLKTASAEGTSRLFETITY